MFKTHAPNSAHHAIHVNCILIGASPAIGPARQSRLREWEQKWASKVQKMCRKHCTITSLLLLQCGYHTNSVLIGLNKIGKWILSVWKCRVKLSENRGKYGTFMYLPDYMEQMKLKVTCMGYDIYLSSMYILRRPLEKKYITCSCPNWASENFTFCSLHWPLRWNTDCRRHFHFVLLNAFEIHWYIKHTAI